MSTRHWRQNDIADPEKLQDKITVIGVGSVGSFTVLTLAKLGCKNIEVYDFDKVEEHNLPNQFYRNSDLGKPKVQALQAIVRDFEGLEIDAHNEKFEEQDDLSGYVIFAVDSMDERLKIWEKVKLNPAIKRLIDARMGGEVLRILTINPTDLDDINFYEKLLYPSTKAVQLPCTARAIIYNILAIASLISNNIKKVMLGEDVPKEIAFDLKSLSLYVNRK